MKEQEVNLRVNQNVTYIDPLGLIRGGAPDNVTQELIRCLYKHKLENVRDLFIDC